MQLSCEEGWKMDVVDLANWLKELAQQVEALEPEDTDATIRKLRVERLDLRVERDDIDQKCSEVEHELTEAKKELESYTDSVNADAEIGRLVRGMRPGASLYRDPNRLSVLCWWGLHSHPYICQKTDDPTEALQALQEVGDGELP